MASKGKNQSKNVDTKTLVFRTVEVVENKVSFQSWYHSRIEKINPSIHKMEVIFADFTARGLSDMENPQDYDKALVLYGIK